MHHWHLCRAGTLLCVLKTIGIFTLTLGNAQFHCSCFKPTQMEINLYSILYHTLYITFQK